LRILREFYPGALNYNLGQKCIISSAPGSN